MKFKTKQASEQYSRVCPLLRLVIEEFERSSLRLGIEPVMTRLVGEIAGDSKVHASGLASDFRDEHKGVRMYTPDEVRGILGEINGKFPRGDSLKTLMHHSFDKGPYHFHLQISPVINTYRHMIYSIPFWPLYH